MRGASGSGGPGPEALAQRSLEDLARGRARQVADEVDRARQLVAGEALAREGGQLVGTRHRARPQDDERLHRLTPPLVGYADDRNLVNRGMLGERLLDLDREDILSAADDHVLDPIRQEEVSRVVEVAAVAGAQPAVGAERRGRLL